jgi:DNA-binding NtrC family response regulator
MLGGDLTLQSVPGQGSTFSMSIPIRYVKDTAEIPAITGTLPALSAKPARGGDTVVVIDDDANTCELLSRLFHKQGLRAIPCKDAVEGIEAIRSARPLAVTLDIQMKGLDGWNTLSVLKNDPELLNIPVIIITVGDEKPLGIRRGAFDYLTKPLDIDQFQAVIQRCKAEYEQEEALRNKESEMIRV